MRNLPLAIDWKMKADHCIGLRIRIPVSKKHVSKTAIYQDQDGMP